MKRSIVLLLVVMAHMVLKSQNLVPYEDAKTKKYGYKNKQGVVVIPAKYDRCRVFFENRAEVQIKLKWGFIDPTGKEIIPLKYEAAAPFSEGLAAVKLNGRWGYIDHSGNVIIDPQYSKATDFKCGRAFVKNAGKNWFINKNGEKVFKASFIESKFSEGLAKQWVSKSAKDNWGYADTTGKMVIPAEYYSATNFEKGIAIVSKNTDKTWLRLVYGAIDKTGKVVIPIIYNLDEDPISFNPEGLAVVSNKEKYGVINRLGKEIVGFNYKRFSISIGKSAIAAVANGKAMLFDLNGNELPLPPNCTKIDGSYFKELWKIEVNGKKGFVDQTGKVIIPTKYDDVSTFDENGVTQAQLNSKYGLINTKGVQVVPFKYDYLGYFIDGLAEIQLGGKYGCINRKGVEVVPPQYDENLNFNNGVVTVVKNGKKGLIDFTGKLIVPCIYKDITDFGFPSTDYTTLKNDADQVGVVSKSGKIIVPLKYRRVEGNFIQGLFLADEGYMEYTLYDKNGKIIAAPKKYGEYKFFGDLIFAGKAYQKYAVLSKTGIELQPPRYEDVALLSGNLLKVKLNGKYGLFDLKTIKETMDFKYDDISLLGSNALLIKLNGKFGLVSSTGKEIIEAKFDNIELLNDRLFLTKLNSKYGIVSVEGKEIMLPIITDIVSVRSDINNDGEILVKANADRYWIDATGNILKE